MTSSVRYTTVNFLHFPCQTFPYTVFERALVVFMALLGLGSSLDALVEAHVLCLQPECRTDLRECQMQGNPRDDRRHIKRTLGISDDFDQRVMIPVAKLLIQELECRIKHDKERRVRYDEECSKNRIKKGQFDALAAATARALSDRLTTVSPPPTHADTILHYLWILAQEHRNIAKKRLKRQEKILLDGPGKHDVLESPIRPRSCNVAEIRISIRGDISNGGHFPSDRSGQNAVRVTQPIKILFFHMLGKIVKTRCQLARVEWAVSSPDELCSWTLDDAARLLSSWGIGEGGQHAKDLDLHALHLLLPGKSGDTACLSNLLGHHMKYAFEKADIGCKKIEIVVGRRCPTCKQESGSVVGIANHDQFNSALSDSKTENTSRVVDTQVFIPQLQPIINEFI